MNSMGRTVSEVARNSDLSVRFTQKETVVAPSPFPNAHPERANAPLSAPGDTMSFLDNIKMGPKLIGSYLLLAALAAVV
ncbi:MAG: hypothetical protein WCO20_06205, partial [Holophagaceae bacterium]